MFHQVTKRPHRSSAGSKKDDTDAVSFRFRRGSKDMFEELVDENNKEALNKDRKRKTLVGEDEEGSGKSSRTRSSGFYAGWPRVSIISTISRLSIFLLK